MSPWIIFGIIFLLLMILSRVRIGANVEWNTNRRNVWIRVGFFRIHVYPLKKKTKHPVKQETKQDKDATNEPEQTSKNNMRGLFSLVLDSLPVLGEAVDRLSSKLRIDRLLLDLTIGDEDPADAVMKFGSLNAALGMLLPFFEHHFDLRERRIRTAVDFEQEILCVNLYAALSFTLGQILTLAFWVAISCFQIFLAWRRKQKKATVTEQKEAVTHGK